MTKHSFNSIYYTTLSAKSEVSAKIIKLENYGVLYW